MTSPRLDLLDRNGWINGNLQDWQRGTNITLSSSWQYLVDRFCAKISGSWTPSLSQDTEIPSYLSKYSMLISGTPAVITDTVLVRQKMIAKYASVYAGKKISASVKIKSTNMKGIRLILATPNTENDFSTTTDFYDQTKVLTSDNNWETIKFENIPVPVASIYGLDGWIEILDAQGLVATTIKMSEFKINLGEIAQEFSIAARNQTDETLLNKQYYEKINTHLNARAIAGAVNVNYYAHILSGAVFDSVKIKHPVVTIYNYSMTANQVTVYAASSPNYPIDSVQYDVNCIVGFSNSSGLLSGTIGYIYWFSWVADAEY